jgi:hypothetical protein
MMNLLSASFPVLSRFCGSVRHKKTRACVSNVQSLRITRRNSFKTSENYRKHVDYPEKLTFGVANLIKSTEFQ